MDEMIPERATPLLDLLTEGVPRRLPRHRHGLSREAVLHAQRARISAAAIELFAETGYAETSVLHIARKAGVSRKTFYALYPSKEEVFLDAYQTLGALLRKLGLGAVPDEHHSGGIDRLHGSIRALLETMAANGSATRMFYLEALGAGTRVRSRRNEAIDQFVDAAVPGLQALRADLEPGLPRLSRQLCHLIVAASIELITEFLADHDPAELPRLVPDLIETVRAIATPNHSALDSPPT
ncbi:helix-turn-helix domain containing protein [Mycobacteroides abscessus]|uniref:TetR/AcrR family transcriptional regulator n=1 Tax=Mycobacteroides abscessus TaxID=36809 RepID=UPI001E441EB3|nr:TetR/AcrR family transcriptional regulator [Mycobacteroides abscessus]MDM2646957.1 helix-turn-helix domain containing protein [Mycobacteroides abscessus]MDM2654643.1 helix-turn-helix domain containing protein [Mycobacteroides abscessus]MDM2665445.1 helix-turn-helix domain containing protein [Mycobacteroides abscessus]MDM2670748.1 helix-turn-helix domain containing protein [Mycobacteroides abscessus]MDM2674825.1 helix-turn-helix domain containing protein [Mycobacteroides abscessus]